VKDPVLNLRHDNTDLEKGKSAAAARASEPGRNARVIDHSTAGNQGAALKK
jgi:hypothetical protein